MNGLMPYNFGIIDLAGDPVRGGIYTSIYESDGETLASIYSDENMTAMTNPITPTALALLNGYVRFWSSLPEVIIKFADDYGNLKTKNAVMPRTRVLKWNPDAILYNDYLLFNCVPAVGAPKPYYYSLFRKRRIEGDLSHFYYYGNSELNCNVDYSSQSKYSMLLPTFEPGVDYMEESYGIWYSGAKPTLITNDVTHTISKPTFTLAGIGYAWYPDVNFDDYWNDFSDYDEGTPGVPNYNGSTTTGTVGEFTLTHQYTINTYYDMSIYTRIPTHELLHQATYGVYGVNVYRGKITE